MFDFAKKKKMPKFSSLSRRLHLLTTDAKPDPPRNGIDANTNNFPPSPSETSQKSFPTTPEPKENREARTDPIEPSPSSNSNSESTENFGGVPSESRKNSKESKNPRFKTKGPHKTAQTANIINYNIINSNGVKIGATKTYVCNVNQCTKNSKESCDSASTKTTKRIMPKSVQDLSLRKREITIDDIFVIKTHIGHGWRDVVRRLGYSEGQLDQFEENHKGKGVDEVVYQAFLDWKQANTKNAQIGILASVLWSCREYECAERLAAALVQETT